MSTKDAYQEYLERKHVKFTTSPEIINQTVLELTGMESLGRKKIIAGEVNEVYEVQLPDEEVIVRISHARHPRFDAERWAIGRCLEVGVPAPKILGIKKINDTEGQNLAICVEEKLPGKPLAELLDDYADNSEFVKSVCRQIGGVLSNIHQIKTSRFGALNANGEGEYPTLEKYLLQAEELKETLLAKAKKINMDPKIIEKALEIIRKNLPLVKDVEPRLLHKDVHPKHFLVEDGKISGVIDFEGCESGDPVMDFAWWDFFSGEKRPTKILAEGYPDKKLISNNFELRLRVYRLFLGLTLLDYYVRENNPSGVNHTVACLIKDTSM